MPRRYVPQPPRATAVRYVVLWDLQWQIIDCTTIAAGSELASSLRAAIDRLERAGWRAEGGPDYGYVFLHRGEQRCLLMITARHPGATSRQSFSPFDGPRT